MVFSQNEIMVMIAVVSVLLICITILTILDIKDYLKAKKVLVSLEEESFGPLYQEEEKEVEPVTVSYDSEETSQEEVLVSQNESVPDEVYLEEMEDEKFDVKKEEEPLILDVKEEVNLPKVEVSSEYVEPTIEKKEKKRLEVLEEFSDIEDNLPNKKDDITNFEMEQERTAIISLDELMQKSNELYNDNEFVQYDDGDEPITIDEVISRFNHESDRVSEVVKENIAEVKETLEEKIEPYSKKETIPFISSVYGIEKDNALEFENTATYEKLDRQNYNDFVAKLREMNENK